MSLTSRISIVATAIVLVTSTAAHADRNTDRAKEKYGEGKQAMSDKQATSPGASVPIT